MALFLVRWSFAPENAALILPDNMKECPFLLTPASICSPGMGLACSPAKP